MPTTSGSGGTTRPATWSARPWPVLILVAALAVGCSSSSTATTSTTTSAQVSTSQASQSSVPTIGAGAPSLVTKADAAAVTLTLSAKTMLPATVTIPVGGTITLMVTDDAQHNIIVGTEAPLAVTKGSPKIFQFGSAGTFDVADISTHAETIVTVK